MKDRADSPAGSLRLDTHIESPDDFYQELIDLHQGLTDEQSAMLNSKLVLILANQIGDMRVIREAFVLASKA